MTARSRCAVALVPLLLVPLAHGAERTSGSNAGSGKETAEAAPARPPSGEGGGVYHPLRRGQTLYSLSRVYGVSPATLARVNGIKDPTRIPAGRRLFVPGATRILDLPSPAGPLLSWPIQGRVTSPFQSGGRLSHEGIDIDGVMGQEVRAAAAGKVVFAGTQQGYGEMIVIDHGGGLSTLYAHTSRFLVDVDDVVEAGDSVAEVGRSGNARGAHLHFEVRRDGRPVNPLPLLGSEISPLGEAR
jgi:LysM repeat protein